MQYVSSNAIQIAQSTLVDFNGGVVFRSRPDLRRKTAAAIATWLALGLAGVAMQAQAAGNERGAFMSEKQAPAADYGPHPSEGADAIVVITPDADYALHRAQKTKRIIKGRMLSNERSIVDITDGAITHAPEAIVTPLEKGKPVKLFLRRYPGANDYYITAIFPADFPSEAVK